MLNGTQIQKKSTFRSKISVPVSLRRLPPIRNYQKKNLFLEVVNIEAYCEIK